MERKTQVAALPVRRGDDGEWRIMLVTSRETRRWVVPKGWPWPDRPDHEAAAEEAREEAGLLGKVASRSIGTYSYDKRRRSGVVPVLVTVFVLEVTDELDGWPEQDQRQRTWFTVSDAAAAVDEPELAALIRSLS